jgi:hypothetical protein
MKGFCLGAIAGGTPFIVINMTIGNYKGAVAMTSWVAVNLIVWSVCMISDAIKEGK